MKIKFKQISDEEVRVIGIGEDGEEKDVGNIFTPSSSGHNNLNAIQICGFTEAFDLWGCAVYKQPRFSDEGTYTRDDKGNKVFQQTKDIQLKFDIETEPVSQGEHFKKPLTKNCWGCFNEPCTCERKVKHDNPYAVKREQDLFLLKKEDDKKSSDIQDKTPMEAQRS